MKTFISGAALAATLFMCTSAATAAPTVHGSIWFVDAAAAENAVPANIPARAPDVTFDAPSSPIDFSIGDSGSETLGTFLASGGAFNLIENTIGALTTITNNTLWLFEGSVTVTSGQVFSVGHDDGLTLVIGGLDLGFDPGPTAPVVTDKTYTGPSGTFPFQLVYGECCFGAAVLFVNLPFESTPVPAPGAAVLLATGLAGLSLTQRRRSA